MKRLFVLVFVLFTAACDVQVGDQMVDPMPFSLRQHRVIGKPIPELPPPSSNSTKRWADSGD